MHIKYLTVALAVCAFASCEKKLSLRQLDFDVTTDKPAYAAGTAVTFNFDGKPDNITFFSGEPGKRYEFIDRVSANGTPQLKFSTALNAGVQPNSLSLMVSADFAGAVTATSDAAAITNATWTDISNRATWATTAATVASGAIDLSDFAAAGKPVYIAFKYNAAAGSIQNKWTVTGLSLRNVLADGTSYVIDTLPTFTTVTNYGNAGNLPGWAGKTISNIYQWTLAATNMVIAGAATTATATAPAEAWVITGPVDLRKVTPDAGTVVQTMANYSPAFSYTYAIPGTYNAVFVAGNMNRNAGKTTMKTIPVTVQ